MGFLTSGCAASEEVLSFLNRLHCCALCPFLLHSWHTTRGLLAVVSFALAVAATLTLYSLTSLDSDVALAADLRPFAVLWASISPLKVARLAPSWTCMEC